MNIMPGEDRMFLKRLLVVILLESDNTTSIGNGITIYFGRVKRLYPIERKSMHKKIKTIELIMLSLLHMTLLPES